MRSRVDLLERSAGCRYSNRSPGKGFSLDVALAVAVPGFDLAKAQDLVAKAHVVCPYSEATRANLDVRLEVGV